MRKEIYLVLIAAVVVLTVFFLNPSLKKQVTSLSSLSSMPTAALGPVAEIYKTTVIVYKGEVQLSDFDKKGVLRPVRMIHEGQSAVVKAKRPQEAEEASRIMGVARMIFPNIISTFYARVETWAQMLSPGQVSYMFSQQDVSASLNKNLSRTLLSDIEVKFHPEGMIVTGTLKAGPIQVLFIATGIVSVDEATGKPILRLREVKAGKINLPSSFLRELEKAFAEVFEKGQVVKLVSIQYQSQGIQVTCIKTN